MWSLFSGPAHAEFHFSLRRSLLPSLPQDVQNPAGLAPTGARRGKTPWRLAGPPHSEQKGFQPFVPIFGVFVNELSNHCFQRTIKSFHQAVRLWVIDAGANRLIPNNHKVREWFVTYPGENLFRDSHPGDHTEQSLRYTLCGNVAERHCLRVSGCIIHQN